MMESERERCRNFEKSRKQNFEKFRKTKLVEFFERGRLARTKNFCAWRVGDCHSRASDQARSKEKRSTSPGRLTPAGYPPHRKATKNTQDTRPIWRRGDPVVGCVCARARRPKSVRPQRVASEASSAKRLCVYFEISAGLDAVSLGRNRLDQP